MNIGVSGIIGILLVIALIVALAAWAAYAYRNPHSASGQMLIRVRIDCICLLQQKGNSESF